MCLHPRTRSCSGESFPSCAGTSRSSVWTESSAIDWWADWAPVHPLRCCGWGRHPRSRLACDCVPFRWGSVVQPLCPTMLECFPFDQTHRGHSNHMGHSPSRVRPGWRLCERAEAKATWTPPSPGKGFAHGYSSTIALPYYLHADNPRRKFVTSHPLYCSWITHLHKTSRRFKHLNSVFPANLRDGA